jgi:hypothetical protein
MLIDPDFSSHQVLGKPSNSDGHHCEFYFDRIMGFQYPYLSKVSV